VARRLRGGLVRIVIAAAMALTSVGQVAAQSFEYVITFNGVAVRHPGGQMAIPERAHAERMSAEESQSGDSSAEGASLDRPGDQRGADPSPARREPPSLWRQLPGLYRRRDPPDVGRPLQSPYPGSERGDRASGRAPRDPLEQARGVNPKARAGPTDALPGTRRGDTSSSKEREETEPARRARKSPLALAPGDATTNPSFEEQGFLIEAFWSVYTGTADGHFIGAHFHPADLSTGFEAQHYGWTHELHGIYIRALDGKPFRLKSLRYRITRNRQTPTHPHSIEGFTNFNVQVLVSRAFDPRVPVRSQFTGFAVGPPLGNDPNLPWLALPIVGFERVHQVYIASSASVDIDDIVLVRDEPLPETEPEAGAVTPAPEPSDAAEDKPKSSER
jgi:hypothetical protein